MPFFKPKIDPERVYCTLGRIYYRSFTYQFIIARSKMCTRHFILKFTDCQCMNNNVTVAYPGSCKDDCDDSGFWYIALFSLFVFIHSTSEVGSMLLILRCVHPQDKAMALGLIQFAIGLFGESKLISKIVSKPKSYFFNSMTKLLYIFFVSYR